MLGRGVKPEVLPEDVSLDNLWEGKGRWFEMKEPGTTIERGREEMKRDIVQTMWVELPNCHLFQSSCASRLGRFTYSCSYTYIELHPCRRVSEDSTKQAALSSSETYRQRMRVKYNEVNSKYIITT